MEGRVGGRRDRRQGWRVDGTLCVCVCVCVCVWHLADAFATLEIAQSLQSLIKPKLFAHYRRRPPNCVCVCGVCACACVRVFPRTRATMCAKCHV